MDYKRHDTAESAAASTILLPRFLVLNLDMRGDPLTKEIGGLVQIIFRNSVWNKEDIL